MTDLDKEKLLEEILKNIKNSAKDHQLNDDQITIMSSTFTNFFNQESIDVNLAQRIGQYFYYYAQIDDVLSKIISSLLPELDLVVMGLESSLDKNSYLKKLELIKSLVPNSEKLKIFPLLHKINKIRNEFAHTSPKKLDFLKINRELTSVFQEAFTTDSDLSNAITREINSRNNYNIPVKVISITKMYLEFFSDIEISGKKADKQLRFFEALRTFSSLHVRRRFSILSYQLQTRTNSDEALEIFKQTDNFDNALKELDLAVKSLLNIN